MAAGLVVRVCVCLTSNSNPEPKSNPLSPYFLTLATSAFRPKSQEELRGAVEQCIEESPVGDCSGGAHGPIGDWDVSAVNQDMSKWDVSTAGDMASMFSGASSFNQDLSKWDVSAVTGMAGNDYE